MEVENFIELVVDLIDDEYSDKLTMMDAKYYLLNGGCLDLALIIKYFYKESTLMIRSDLDHWAVLYNQKLYDATGEIEDIENYRQATKIDYLMSLDLNRNEINNYNGIKLSDNIINKVKTYYREETKVLL